MKFSVYQVSHRGGRELNEDRLAHAYTQDAVLLLLADGMGGHPEGEQAAEIAVQTFRACFEAEARPVLADVEAFLTRTLDLANQAILDYARERSLPDQPRTTLVVALLQDNRLHRLHCGDSRLYWVRRGRMLARTRDHSWHERPGLARAGAMPLDRSVLFTCLGSSSPPIFELGQPMPLHEGDRLLLCSDGLWDRVDDAEIARLLDAGPLEQVVPGLAELALARAGRYGDNVSLLALEWRNSDGFPATLQLPVPFGQSPFHGADPAGPDAGLLVRELDDEELDRAIAEINESIRRRTEPPPS